MKKAISLLLALVMCLSLCACGEKITTVELTLENWNSFFEIKRINQWKEDAFGDVTSVESAVWFCVKDEYIGKINIDDILLALEVTYQSADTTYIVDFLNKELTFGGSARTEYPFESRTDTQTYSQDSINFNDKYFTGEEYAEETPLICLFQPDWIDMNPLAVDLDGNPYQTFEISPTVTRIQGTITVSGEVPDPNLPHASSLAPSLASRLRKGVHRCICAPPRTRYPST